MNSVVRMAGFVVYKNEVAIFATDSFEELKKYILEQYETGLIIRNFLANGAISLIDPVELKIRTH